MASVTTGGTTYTSNSKTPYVDIYNQYAKNLQNQTNTYKQNQATQREADLNRINGAYDSNAKQYYIQSMQQQKGLNSQLAAQGINGGASESAMLRMNNAYGQNLAKNESSRQNDLTTTNTTYDTNLANYLAEQESNRANMYTTMMQNQAEYEENQRDKELQNYAASITDRFGSDKAWKKYIASVKNLKNDPLRKQKLALAQQAYNQWKMNNKSSSGGSGGGYSSSYGGYGSSSSTDSTSGESGNDKLYDTASKVANSLKKAASGVSKSMSKTKKRTKRVPSHGAMQ